MTLAEFREALLQMPVGANLLTVVREDGEYGDTVVGSIEIDDDYNGHAIVRIT